MVSVAAQGALAALVAAGSRRVVPLLVRSLASLLQTHQHLQAVSMCFVSLSLCAFVCLCLSACGRLYTFVDSFCFRVCYMTGMFSLSFVHYIQYSQWHVPNIFIPNTIHSLYSVFSVAH